MSLGRLFSCTSGTLALFGGLLLVMIIAGGCDRPPEPSTPGGGSVGNGLDELSRPRIVSLAPALTQMVVDLDLGDLIVGVCRYDGLSESRRKNHQPPISIVGDILDLNTEALLALKPTLVLVMPTKQGVPPRLNEMAQAGRFQLLVYPPPHSIQEVGQLLLDEKELIGQAPTGQTPSLGTALGVAAKAQQVKLEMLIKLQRLGELCRRDQPASVLMVIGIDPLMASGPQTTHDQLLKQIGAINAVQSSNHRAPVLDREKLLQLQPDVVLVLLPGALPLKPLDQDDRLAAFRGLDIPAVKNQRIVLIDDLNALLPSSSMARTAAIMARAIYPELAESIDRIMAQDQVTAIERKRRQAELPVVDLSRDLLPTPAPPSSNPVKK